MTKKRLSFSDTYTCKVSGETYRYDANYTPGQEVAWIARIYLGDELKGAPSGAIIDNVMQGDDLRQYIVAYIEGIIEKGLGIEE